MSTTEYVAAVLLVSIVLAVGGAQVAGVDLADAVVRKMKVALCIVAGDDCDADGEERACVVSSKGEGEKKSAGLFLARLGDGRHVLRERLSNGRVRLTVTQGTDGAVGKEVDVKASVLGKEVDVSAGIELGGEVSYGRSYEVEDDAAADRLQQRIDRQDWKVGGALRGAVRMLQGDGDGARTQALQLKSRAEASAALDLLGFEPGAASITGGPGAGVVRDHHTGQTSLVLAHDATASAAVDAEMASVGFALGAERRLQLTFDRDRRPVALKVSSERAGQAGGQAGRLEASGGGRAEMDAELDLTDPELAADAGRLARGDVGALPALMRHMAARARLTTRVYTTTREEDDSGFSVVGVGYEHERTAETAKLQAAYVRKPGRGLADWEPTCLHTA